MPGLVVPAEEGAFWTLAGGSLLKFRLTLLPDRGLTLVPAGAGLPVGAPTQPAQLNPHRDTACFVVRSSNSSGCRAVAVRLLGRRTALAAATGHHPRLRTGPNRARFAPRG